jgi:FHS family glucose/mannose:H+ symporter-like MFS transporter
MKNSLLLNYLMEIPNFLSMFIFAFFMMMTSPILLDIGNFFKVGPEIINLIVTFLIVGVIFGLITSLFLNRKFKKNYIILASYILVIPILVILGLTKSLVIFNILYFLFGYFIGLVWINANSNMVESKIENKDSVVNFGHGFFAFGALIAPFVSTGLISRNISWNILYFIVIILVIINVLTYIFILKKNSYYKTPEQVKKPFKDLFRNKYKNIFFLFSVIMIMLAAGSETLVGSWAPTFFRVQKMFSLTSAGFILTIFYIGLLTGRLGIGFLSYRLKARYIMIGSSIISIAALICAIFIDNQIISFIAIGFVGLGFSGLTPLILSTTSTIYDSNRGIVASLVLFFGLSGSALTPYLIKMLSGRNMVLSLSITIFLMIVVLIFTLIRFFYKRKYISE